MHQASDWQIGGSVEPRGKEVMGFTEAQVAQACVMAYYTAFGKLDARGGGVGVEVFLDTFVQEC
jgi:hypothetical protein